MNQLSPNIQGALWMSASMLGFVINDTLTKSVSDQLGLFQIVLVRGVFATALILLIAWRAGALRYRPTAFERKWMGWRVLGEVLGTCFFLTALFNMPIANAVAILQCVGLAVTLAAALFLGDAVGWRRYLAIVIGFCGVLLIVRPGTEGFNVYSLSALAAVAAICLRDLATRQIGSRVPGLMVTVVTSVVITAMGAVVTLFGDWKPVEWDVLIRLIAAAVFVLLGYNAGVMAMRVGEVGFVSPFRYLNLLWAMILGYFVFGDLPGPITLLGAALIVGTGLYTLHRERLTGRIRPERASVRRP